jgi:hypothetical protein
LSDTGNCLARLGWLKHRCWPRVCQHYWDGGDGSQFFSVLGMRSDAYRGPHGQVLVRGVDTGCLLATNDDELGKIGLVPSASTPARKNRVPGASGCGANPAILHSRPRRWTRHSLRARLPTPATRTCRRGPRLRLAGFSFATPSNPVVLTGPRTGDTRPCK